MERGAFFAPTLLRCAEPHANAAVHDVEAFGPVSTLMPYDEVDEAVALAARGRGSLVATLVTREPEKAPEVEQTLKQVTLEPSQLSGSAR